jgi:hypothetical protein
MRVLKLLLIAVILYSCNSNEEIDLNYVGFEKQDYDFGVTRDGETTQDLKIYSTNKVSSDRSFDIFVVEDETTLEPSSYVLASTTVTIPSNENVGTFPLTIKDLNIGEGKTLVLNFQPKDDTYLGQKMVLNISRVCPYNTVIVKFEFDGYASETTWSITDSSSTVVASGGPWTDGLESFSTELCLEDGTYTFTVNDSYGDGLSYPADGSVTLTSGVNTLYNVVGNFGFTASGSFTVTK